jgi:sulfite reductase (ferredoxin)
MRQLFPCDRFGQDASSDRLSGLYPQRQDGLWMQRLKNPGGVVSGSEWRALASLAREFTPGTPLHLTSRADVEFHNVPESRVAELQSKLAEAGLTGRGACGDTLRNVTVCPCSGLLQGSVDLHPIAHQLEEAILAFEGIYAMPRKFKITLACSESCGRPWINDLGLIATMNKAGQVGFRVIGAGSLGARPATGIELCEWIAPADVIPLAMSMIELFAAEGDRENRRQARFRHVRERMGDDVFADRIAELFADQKKRTDFPEVAPLVAAGTMRSQRTLKFFAGLVTPEQAEAMATLADDARFVLRLTVEQTVVAMGAEAATLDDAIAKAGLADNAREQMTMMVCPGTRWCKLAAADTEAMAGAIRDRLGDRLDADAMVCISGCANGCTHYGVASVGLFGVASQDGQERFNLLTGGGNGRNDKLASRAAPRLTIDEAIAAIEADVS